MGSESESHGKVNTDELVYQSCKPPARILQSINLQSDLCHRSQHVTAKVQAFQCFGLFYQHLINVKAAVLSIGSENRPKEKPKYANLHPNFIKHVFVGIIIPKLLTPVVSVVHASLAIMGEGYLMYM